jgi:adenine-specific DNA-methyltransferase
MMDIPKLRLLNQQLANPLFHSPKELVSWMGAVQAQDYAMVKWAVGMRLASATVRTVEEALQKGAILRGRDIKRYGYEWAEKYLIATFPSRHYDIEQYPAVKQHLLSFGEERLEQTGKTYTINGEKVKARKKTNNKWFETQDSISYWEDFSKPKIVWGEISDKAKFAFDFLGEYIPEATTFYLNGEYIEYLLTALNSSVSEWLFSKTGTTTGVGTIRWKKYTIEQLIVAKPNYEQQKEHLAAFEKLKAGKMSILDFEYFSNKLMYDIYGLTKEEIHAIENLYN